MKDIIVTIRDKNNTFQHDIDVPTDKPGMELTSDIFEVLDPEHRELYLNPRYHAIYLNRVGRLLRDNETLADAGILNGDYVTIVSRM